MLGLHISVFSGRLFLWCESETLEDIKNLKKAVKNINLDWKILKKHTQNLYAFLPSYKDDFISSNELIKKNSKRKLKIELAPFEVCTFELSVNNLLEILHLCREGNLHGSGVVFGESFYWIDNLLTLSLNVINQKSYLPAIVKNEYYEARWTAVFNESNEVDFFNIINSMPSVIRCLSDDYTDVPLSGKKGISEILVNLIIDTIIRDSIEQKKVKKFDSLHDAWLFALTDNEAVIDWAAEKDIREFKTSLESWRRPIDIAIKSAYKICFRLSEPEKNNEDWSIDYLLQPKQDLSVLLPLKDYWKKNEKTKKIIKLYGALETEFILAGLGQASSICPLVSVSLKSESPFECIINDVKAINFLKNYADTLRVAGFNVILPSWWINSGTKEKIKMQMKINSKNTDISSGLTLESLLSYDYTLSIGDEELSLKELKELVKLKKQLVNIRGQWVQIDIAKLNQAIKFLESKKNKDLDTSTLIRFALGAKNELDHIEIDEIIADECVRGFLDSLKNKSDFKILPQPKSVNGVLRDYQLRGFSWLSFLKKYRLGACLADDMGLGKTIQTLALIANEVQNGDSRPNLLICPTSVVNNWKKEAEKFTPNLKVMVHHGSGRLKEKEFSKRVTDFNIIISSYGLIHRDLDVFKQVKWSTVVIDEAQYIKNSETKQSKAARSIESDFKIALTGTPVENHVGDLWSLMEFLNKGFLGTYNNFKTNFLKPIQLYKDIETAKVLKNMSNPFILRRLKTDKTIIKDLPEKIESKDYCNLTKEQASLYSAVVEEIKETIKASQGIERKGLILSSLVKLKQVCNHPVLFNKDNSDTGNRSGKLNRLIEILEEVNGLNEKTLIFTQFKEMGELLQKHLQDYFGEEVYFLHGSLSKKKRDELVEMYQSEDSKVKIFILSLKAGGTGLNLTKANHVIHYDRWWNPAVENQATDRVFRIGQRNNVQVHKFIVSGTLEEKIDDMIERKQYIADLVVNIGESWLSELSNNDFINLISLDKDSVGD